MPAEKSVEELINDLFNDDLDTARNAAIELGEIKDKNSVLPLITAATGPRFIVQIDAIISLGKIADPAAIPCLKLLMDDQNHYIRRAALKSIGLFRSPEFSQLLISHLNDPEYKEKEFICESLRFIKDPETVVPLVQIIENAETNEYKLFYGSLNVLIAIDYSRHQDLISNLLKSQCQEIRIAAVCILSKLPSQNSRELLMGLIKLPSQNSSEFMGLIDDGDYKIRLLAVLALSNYSDAIVIDELMKILNSDIYQDSYIVLTGLLDIDLFSAHREDIDILDLLSRLDDEPEYYIDPGIRYRKWRSLRKFFYLLREVSGYEDNYLEIHYCEPVARALAKIGLPVLDHVMKAINENNGYKNWNPIFCILLFLKFDGHSEEILIKIMEKLRAPDSFSRLFATRFLSYEGDIEYYQLLSDLITEDPDSMVRCQALAGICNIYQDSTPEMQEVILIKINEIKENDPDHEVRTMAVDGVNLLKKGTR
jgi:HEAT repeat protein